MSEAMIDLSSPRGIICSLWVLAWRLNKKGIDLYAEGAFKEGPGGLLFFGDSFNEIFFREFPEFKERDEMPESVFQQAKLES